MKTPGRETAQRITWLTDMLLAHGEHALPPGLVATLRHHKTAFLAACATQPWAQPGHRTRYTELANQLAQQITTGQLKPGQRMPPASTSPPPATSTTTPPPAPSTSSTSEDTSPWKPAPTTYSHPPPADSTRICPDEDTQTLTAIETAYQLQPAAPPPSSKAPNSAGRLH
jgi:hypothetical protein